MVYCFKRSTRLSGLRMDFTRWPMPGMRMPCCFMWLMNCSGGVLLSQACLKYLAASSIAPPNRGPMVRRPEHKEEMMSLPARAVTMELCAPDTAGPWSAQRMMASSMNFVISVGSFFLKNNNEMMSPMPEFCSMNLLIGMLR